MRQKKQGFTFVEMLIVMLLISILGVSVLGALSSGIKIWKRVYLGTENEDKYIFLQKLSHDLKNYRPFKGLTMRTKKKSIMFPALFLTKGSQADKDEELIHQLGMIKYEYLPSEKSIIKTQIPYPDYKKKSEGTSSTLARNVTGLRFSYFYMGEFGITESKPKGGKNSMPVMISVNIDYTSPTGDNSRIRDYVGVPMPG